MSDSAGRCNTGSEQCFPCLAPFTYFSLFGLDLAMNSPRAIPARIAHPVTAAATSLVSESIIIVSPVKLPPSLYCGRYNILLPSPS